MNKQIKSITLKKEPEESFESGGKSGRVQNRKNLKSKGNARNDHKHFSEFLKNI